MVEITEASTAPMMEPARPILAVRKKTVIAESPEAAIWAKEIFLKKFLQRLLPPDLFFLAVLSSRVPIALIGYIRPLVERGHGPSAPSPFKAGPEGVIHIQ